MREDRLYIVGIDLGHGRVATGSCPPAAPTDPDVRHSRIRLLELRNRCTTVHTVYDTRGASG